MDSRSEGRREKLGPWIQLCLKTLSSFSVMRPNTFLYFFISQLGLGFLSLTSKKDLALTAVDESGLRCSQRLR